MTFVILTICPMFFYWTWSLGIIIAIVGAFILFTCTSAIGMARWMFCGAIIGIVLIIIGVAIAIPSDSMRPYTIIPEHSWNATTIQNITSLGDGQSYSMSGEGHFFLGSGSISINGHTSPQYVFYKVMPQGYQIGTLDATDVFVREDENNYPYIEWDYHHNIAPLKTMNDTHAVDYYINGAETVTLATTIIHIPNGTVIKDYKLDSALS